jgi:hypothetical protein
MPITLHHGFYLVHILASFATTSGRFKLYLVTNIEHNGKIKQKKHEFAAIPVFKGSYFSVITIFYTFLHETNRKR